MKKFLLLIFVFSMLFAFFPTSINAEQIERIAPNKEFYQGIDNFIKGEMKKSDIDLVFAGDLLNQCVGSTFGLKDFKIPYLGQYGACSTMAQNLIAASVFVSSGAAEKAACSTSSHFCSAERQYRYPLEYGSVRTPTAQWTVTGAGCCIIGKDSKRIKISRATVGKIIDLGVTDANNMGAAMAPAMCIIEP